MRRGVKPGGSDRAQRRGTYRPDRHAGYAPAVASPSDPPCKPDWLTPAGCEIWDAEFPRVVRSGAVTELDSSMFGTFCNLAGALAMAWRAGAVPPTSAVREARRLAEAFELFGYLSRISSGP